MSLPDTNSPKLQTIQTHGRHDKDTGSPEVQVALYTKKLEQYTKHFETHKNDEHSRRGMFRIISRRKRLLEYLKGINIERYRATIAALGLRK